MKGLNLVGIAPEKDWPWVANLELRPDEELNYQITSQSVVVDINARPSIAA
jgi:hypothetical protein